MTAGEPIKLGEPMELDPEVHAHKHETGHRWLDLALGLSVLVISIASMIIAIQNHHAMKNLVTANSWPYLEMGHGNVMDGSSDIHFDIKNAGVGPALIEKFVVTYDGRSVSGTRELLRRCCGIQDADLTKRLDINVDQVSDRVLSARDDIAFLSMPKQDANLDLWQKLNLERFKVGMTACYSSVLGEHWITSLHSVKPLSVESCDQLSGPSFDAGDVFEKTQ